MISHANAKAKEINKFLWNLKDVYGDNIAESTGELNDYLGMQFGFSFQNKFRIKMMQFIHQR
jgi:hypothetical protein